MAVSEPAISDARQYAQRVYALALAFTGLFFGSLVGIGLIIWKAQFFVSLTQRSNVETLTLAFFLVLFGYVAVLSRGGFIGALRIAYFELLARTGVERVEVERRKIRALGRPGGNNPYAALNVILELETKPGQPFRVEVADEAGSCGPIDVDGACIRHVEPHREGSNSLLAYFGQQVIQVARERGVETEVDVVDWSKINDDTTMQYLGMVQFARRLERHLGADELWPKVTLTEEDCRKLERRLSELCPTLRNEGFLPDWEYSAEHKLPIIPEPLGLISLSRNEKRADPLSAMGCAVLVVFFTVFVLLLLIRFPPWVPGA
jgi:hypothetical protein